MAQVVSGGRIAWLYQARRVNTQTAGGGGALVTRIPMTTGQIGKVVSLYALGTASAGATLTVTIQDEDGVTHQTLAAIGAGASREARLPSIGAAASSTGNMPNTLDILLAPGQTLAISSSAALQNETQTIAITLLLFNVSTEPTWDTTGSAGTPSLAASTISAANTLQMVLV